MKQTEPKKTSDYKERGFAGLHIKKETRQRLNVAKAHVQARANRFIPQDEFINLLLNQIDLSDLVVAETEPQP